MAHSLTTPAPFAATLVSTESKKKPHLQTLGFQRVWVSHHQSSAQALDDRLIHRRNISLGLLGAVLGLSSGNQSARAARRPPPPPPQEKQDPNLSGVQAKVLASKKRKEAMKETVAKLREQGKAINQPSE
ncbi:uncharacterized protein LOC117914629 [Vitis riparia]|uniref:uncharacterized protein LOC117914629 n=1 Tax=Vitis riparia TaxID=96939 RepID=UPI00155AD0AD|nr:uncharacterized protein LOC117914629 [Vitis riparia]